MRIFAAPRALLFFLLSGGAAVAAGACGYPTFSFDPGSSSATGTVVTGGGGDSGTAGTGGDPTPTTSSVSSAASSSSTGAGCTIVHEGNQGTCEYQPHDECGCTMAGQKCSVASAGQKTGASSCVPVSMAASPPWLLCDSDANCEKGTFCDHLGKVCKPMCVTPDDCGGPGRRCIPAVSTLPPPTEIPGLQICTAHCDPETASPCGAGATCVRVSTSDFDCTTSLGKIEGVGCTFSDECTVGLLCIGTAAVKTCEPWCHPADAGLLNGCPWMKPYCNPFATAVTYNGTPYGYCDTSSKP